MTTKTPLPDYLIKPHAFELTSDKMNELGLEPSNIIRINVEGMLHDSKLKGHHCIAIGWPDKTFCTFASVEPISFNDLYPVLLQEAYRRSLYDHKFDTWLG